MQFAVFLVTLNRHGFELLFIATLDPQGTGLFHRWRYAAGRVNTARNVMAGFDQPPVSRTFFGKLFGSPNPRAIGIGGAPTDKS